VRPLVRDPAFEALGNMTTISSTDPCAVKRIKELGDRLDYAESHFGFYDGRTDKLGREYCIAAHTIREPVADFDTWAEAHAALRHVWMPSKRALIDLHAACYLSFPEK
jgi:hypothetical protein